MGIQLPGCKPAGMLHPNDQRKVGGTCSPFYYIVFLSLVPQTLAYKLISTEGFMQGSKWVFIESNYSNNPKKTNKKSCVASKKYIDSLYTNTQTEQKLLISNQYNSIVSAWNMFTPSHLMFLPITFPLLFWAKIFILQFFFTFVSRYKMKNQELQIVKW